MLALEQATLTEDLFCMASSQALWHQALSAFFFVHVHLMSVPRLAHACPETWHRSDIAFKVGHLEI